MIFSRKLRPLNRIEISRKVILGNFNRYKKLGKAVWPVVKSNAYGAGLEQIVKILNKYNFEYWVADSYMEALRIWKKSGKKVLLIGSMLKENYGLIDFSRVVLMIQNFEEIIELGRLNKKIKIHLKINSGMNRQGFDLSDLDKVLKLLKKYKKIEVDGLMSHLAEASNKVMTEKQEKKFLEALEILKKEGINPKWIHLGATDGAFKTKNLQINAVRLGVGIYRNSMKLISTLVKVRQIRNGEKVSYGMTFEAKKDGWLGVIPVGYYEGLDRKLSNVGEVKYKGKYYRIAGRVCMNMCVIDFGGRKPKLYDEVEVIGESGKNSFEFLAPKCQTIDYEMMVRLNGSIRREVV
jgi:alanine racemase